MCSTVFKMHKIIHKFACPTIPASEEFSYEFDAGVSVFNVAAGLPASMECHGASRR